MPFRRHCRRAGRQEREGRRIRYDVVLMPCWQALFRDLDVMGKHAITTALRLPKLYRHRDGRIAGAGKDNRQRVGDDGGPDPRIVRERVSWKLLSADLLAGMGRRLL